MPFVYSGAAAAIAHFGWHVSNSVVIQIVAIAGGILTLGLHAAEAKWPWVGALLGYIGAPTYTPATKVTVAQLQAQIAALAAQLEEAKAPSTPTAPAPSPAPVVTPVAPAPVVTPIT
jgi:hypothetical protein